MTILDKRSRACAKLLAEVHAITAHEGSTPSALHAVKLKLVALARRTELFQLADFAMPVSQGRNHPLLVEDGDGLAMADHDIHSNDVIGTEPAIGGGDRLRRRSDDPARRRHCRHRLSLCLRERQLGPFVSHLDAGEVAMLPRNDVALSPGQVKSGHSLACRGCPRSDVTIEWLGRGGR